MVHMKVALSGGGVGVGGGEGLMGDVWAILRGTGAGEAGRSGLFLGGWEINCPF